MIRTAVLGDRLTQAQRPDRPGQGPRGSFDFHPRGPQVVYVLLDLHLAVPVDDRRARPAVSGACGTTILDTGHASGDSIIQCAGRPSVMWPDIVESVGPVAV